LVDPAALAEAFAAFERRGQAAVLIGAGWRWAPGTDLVERYVGLLDGALVAVVGGLAWVVIRHVRRRSSTLGG
jgi:hypothetical protein